MLRNFIIIIAVILQPFISNAMEKQEIYLAGGCYWGLEFLIQDIDGVIDTEVGFSGGDLVNATYEDVKTGTTGHAETIRVEYDSTKLSTQNLLFEFFRMHNPTTKNQQGNDIGTQYRSAVFYLTSHQKEDAQKAINHVNEAGHWKEAVVTEILEFNTFFAAEESHQDYIKKNPNGYSCHFTRDFKFY